MEHISKALAKVVNLEPAKQELTKPVIGEEKRFLECLEDKRVIANSAEELKEVLRLVMVKIGLRAQNWPSDEEKGVLLSHIVTQFGNHTRQEILLAFDMVIAGKLEDGEGEQVDANCYENFSCLYFSKVMIAYRRWAAEVYKQNKKDLPMLPESKEDTSDIAMEDWMADVSLRIQAGGYDVQLVPPMLYEWMDKKGEIKKTAAEKREYLSKAAAHRVVVLSQNLAANPDEKNKTALEVFCAMMNKGMFEGDEVERLKLLAKKMILFDMLKAEPK
jgi:hypothetical protein